MESSSSVTNPSGLPGRLKRFKDVCLQKRTLKGRIEKLIETREALAVRELERAESELERIKAKAVTVRSQMVESRPVSMADWGKSEEVMNFTSNGPLNPASLIKAAGLEGGSPSVRATSVVRDSTRNSPSFKSAESPVLSPSNDQCSVAGSLGRTSFRLDHRSEDGTTTDPFAVEDGQSCDDRLALEAQRYAELCEERRELEREIMKELDDEQEAASMRVEKARSSLREVRGKIADIKAGLKKASGEDAMIDLPPTPSVGDLNGGELNGGELHGGELHGGELNEVDRFENAPPSSSEVKPGPPASISEASTHHHKSVPSVHSFHTLRSPTQSHFARPPAQSPEETQATGSHLFSLSKPRKKLHKRVLKLVERTQGVPSEDAAPLFTIVGGE